MAKIIVQKIDNIDYTCFLELTESQLRLLKWLKAEEFIREEDCIIHIIDEKEWEEV